MINLLSLSDCIKTICERVTFAAIVTSRFFKILFRRRKKITLLQLSYYKDHQFTSSYLVIRYRFRNALWYNFKKIKKTTGKDIIILNLKNIPDMPIELVVYGFFRKKTFSITVVPSCKVQYKHFKTSLKGLNSFEIKHRSISLQNKRLVLTPLKIALANLRCIISFPKTQLKQSSYTQTDFI